MSLTKADPNKQGWEEAEFPLVCETCLGENPYVRMTKKPFASECKTCQRPFTVFRWQPGSNKRSKKTEICQHCAKVKNVCQTCVLDLQYGIPVQVRDNALKIESTAPKSDINRQYHAQNLANKVDQEDQNEFDPAYTSPESRKVLQKLARSEPYYKRNRPHLCSFFAKGECSRGPECPYRHEKPADNGLGQQNIQDRYHGTNDPVAKKMTARLQSSLLTPPDDKSISSLLMLGIKPEITDETIRGFFEECGEIKSPIVRSKGCALVNFVTRMAAELAADKIPAEGLSLQGHPVKVRWAKSKPQGSKANGKKTGTMQPPAPPSLKAPSTSQKYPSQDPTSQA